MATNFVEIIYTLKDYGVYEVVLPFLLMFTVIFAILEKTKLFGTEEGKPKTNINAVLAVVISFIVIANTEIVYVMNNYLSRVSLIIIIALLAMLLFGLLGVNVETGFSGFTLLALVILSIFGILWALNDQNYLGIDLSFLGSRGSGDGIILLIVAFIVVSILIWVVSPPKSGRQQGKTTLRDFINKELRNE